jgi:hypothetical protein
MILELPTPTGLSVTEITLICSTIISILLLLSSIIGLYVRSRTEWAKFTVIQDRMQIDITQIQQDQGSKFIEHKQGCISKFTEIEKTADRDRKALEDSIRDNRADHVVMFNKVDEVKDILITFMNHNNKAS